MKTFITRKAIVAILFLNVLFYASAHAGLYTLRQHADLSVNQNHSCVLDDVGVHCWGDNTFGQTDVPQLKNPKTVSVGPYHSCALDDDGVHCWGKIGKMNVPPLINPTLLSGGYCAYDDSGLHCWDSGAWSFPYNPGVPFNRPRILYTNGGTVCVVDADSTRCWADSYSPPNVQLDVIKSIILPLHNPVSISASDVICAIDDDGLRCTLGQSSILQFPTLNNPRQVNVGNDFACALDDDGVHCWGRHSQPTQPVPPLSHPTHLGVDQVTACALDDDGLHCWGYVDKNFFPVSPSSTLATTPPQLHFAYNLTHGLLDPHLPRFNLDQLVDLNSTLIKISTPARAMFHSQLADFTGSKLSSNERSDVMNQSRYLMVKLLSPAVLTDDSTYFVRTFNPRFRGSIYEIEKDLGIHDIAQVPATPLNREIALRIIHSAVSIMVDFLSPDERATLAMSQRLIGQALANPSDSSQITALVQAVDAMTPLMQKAESNPKAAFLIQTVRLAEEWLKGNSP